MEESLLFGERSLWAFLQNRRAKMLEEIDAVDKDRFLGKGVEEWCDYFEKRYKIEPLRLIEDQKRADYQENREGVGLEIYIPFEGEPELFQWQPDQFTSNPPIGTIVGNELVLTYQQVDNYSKEDLQSALNARLENIRQYIDRVNNMVFEYNQSLRGEVQRKVEARRERLLKAQSLIDSLGIPPGNKDNVSNP